MLVKDPETDAEKTTNNLAFLYFSLPYNLQSGFVILIIIFLNNKKLIKIHLQLGCSRQLYKTDY